MAPRCTICAHPERTAIETAMAAGAAIRAIARQYSVSKDALARHRDGCGALVVADARRLADDARQPTVREELARVLARINLLFDACDRYLRDPDHPERYDLSPRAEEVSVVYIDGDRFRKATLATLLRRLRDETGLVLGGGEWKVADPRMLVLKTAEQLTKQLELLAKLTGELDERPEINVLVHPQWIEVRTAVLGALQAHPAALEAVAHALTTLPQGE